MEWCRSRKGTTAYPPQHSALRLDPRPCLVPALLDQLFLSTPISVDFPVAFWQISTPEHPQKSALTPGDSQEDCCYESVTSGTCVTLNGLIVTAQTCDLVTAWETPTHVTAPWPFYSSVWKASTQPLGKEGEAGGLETYSATLSLKLQDICCSNPEGSQSDHMISQAIKAWAKLKWVLWLDGFAVFSLCCLWRFMAHQNLKVESWLLIYVSEMLACHSIQGRNLKRHVNF